MSGFMSRLAATNLDPDFAGGRGLWELTEPLVYDSERAAMTITVPVGFQTDFASVLRLPVIYLLFGDKAHAPATVHDYLYHSGIVPRPVADDVFYEAMRAGTKLSRTERWMMWSAVRLFGGAHYKAGGSNV
jgi:hypothetical protein